MTPWAGGLGNLATGKARSVAVAGPLTGLALVCHSIPACWISGRSCADRDGSIAEPLSRKEGAEGSGQLSSNGDWDNVARIHALLKEAHSDTSSNAAEGPLSPPDSRVGSLAGSRAGTLPPVGERDERPEAVRQ
jgi:hypothetical protein